ncbi:hypothetical protein GC177_07465 [bacterium]|nr:hypothetical protein [bacterium]
MKPEFKKRLISTAVLMPLAIWLLSMGGSVVMILALLLGLAMLREWQDLTEIPKAERLWSLLPTALAWITLSLGFPIPAFTMLGITLLTLALLMKKHMVSGWTLLGIAYLSAGVMPLIWLVHVSPVPWYFLWLMGIVWASDIGGYAFGKTLQGPKLAPAISPGKTVSGAMGGTAMAGMVGIGVAHCWLPEYTVQVIAISLLVSMASQAGDLLESKFKRLLNKKDSGHIIPGHGGLLDRLDGLLAAGPAMLVLLWLVDGFSWWAA